MTLDAYVGLLGKLDLLPLFAAPDDNARNQIDVLRLEREVWQAEAVRILPGTAED